MNGPRFILSKNRMMILFNRLIEAGYDKNLRIAAPLLAGTSLFKFHLKANNVRASDFISSEEYGKIYSEIINNLTGNVKREIPSFDNIRSTLYQSGILRPSGLEQLEEMLSSLRNQDVIRGGNVYYVALDTNMLRDRFYSVYLANIPPHPNLDFVLCETVRSELKNRYDKITRGLFSDPYFEEAGIPVRCFMNQNSLQDRMRYIGFLEYNRMRSATSCEEIDADSRRSGRLNDQIILESYSDFVDVGRKVIFISRDNEAVRMMTGEDNVIPILLEQRARVRSDFEVTWAQFFDLIYLLGVLFGKISLMVGGVETAAFDGVWRQKDVEEWEEDLIRLVISKPKAGDEVEMKEYKALREKLLRNLSALDRLKEEGML